LKRRRRTHRRTATPETEDERCPREDVVGGIDLLVPDRDGLVDLGWGYTEANATLRSRETAIVILEPR
jgi:hypothetical protein